MSLQPSDRQHWWVALIHLERNWVREEIQILWCIPQAALPKYHTCFRSFRGRFGWCPPLPLLSSNLSSNQTTACNCTHHYIWPIDSWQQLYSSLHMAIYSWQLSSRQVHIRCFTITWHPEEEGEIPGQHATEQPVMSHYSWRPPHWYQDQDCRQGISPRHIARRK